MRLPGAVAGLFERWLEEHFPDRKEKVLNRIRDLRGGQLYDPRFGNRMRGEGLFADQIRATFQTFKRRHGLDQPFPELSTALIPAAGAGDAAGLVRLNGLHPGKAYSYPTGRACRRGFRRAFGAGLQYGGRSGLPGGKSPQKSRPPQGR